MDTFKKRLPSRQAFGMLFATCVLTVQAWAFFNLFREVPALRIRMEPWELVGTIAYIQAFALLESMVVALAITLLALLLPSRWLKAQFAALGSALVLVSAAWAVAAHYQQPLANWPPANPLLWGGGYLLSLLLVCLLIQRSPRIERGVNGFLQGLVVLALLYAFVGVLSMGIVAIRNL